MWITSLATQAFFVELTYAGDIGVCISTYIYTELRNAITRPCPTLRGGLAKSHLRIRNGRVIIHSSKQN